jgi:uncharacterized repeat protein (TIGR01451 family)
MTLLSNIRFLRDALPGLVALVLCVAFARPGAAQDDVSTSDADAEPLDIQMRAEKIQTMHANGHDTLRLVAADRVVAGDMIIYTVEVRNRGHAPLEHPSFTRAIPEHMRYIAASAVAPGADVSYSVDGGRNFDVAENLRVHGANGMERAAAAGEYTHIRWILKNKLQPGSLALARFRAILQ